MRSLKIMLFVVCYTQPVNCMGVLPPTSVVPSTFASIGQHSIYSVPPRELPLSVLCASLHTSLPCPSHLHPSVRLHNTGLWKEKTEIFTETYSLILLRMTECGAYWFVLHDLLDVSIFPFPNPAPVIQLLACSVSY